MASKLRKNFSLRKFFQESNVTVEEQLIKDELSLVSNSKHLKFYHGSMNKTESEKLLHIYLEKREKKHKLGSVFLIRDGAESQNGRNDFVLTILNENKYYHYKIENIEDSYFKLPDETIVHGLDTFVDIFRKNKHFLPCKLKKFLNGGHLPPYWSIRLGYTNLLHRVACKGSLIQLKSILYNPKCPQINIKDSYGLLIILFDFT
jgi:hypothetical protein